MGVAYYPELNPPIPGLDPHLRVGGKPIARAMPLLDEWAGELGVRPLSSYYSESLEETFEHIGEPVPPELKGGPKDKPVDWSDPAEGIRTVRAILARLESQEPPVLTVKDQNGREREVHVGHVIADLKAIESVLLEASNNGSRFRLLIDF